MSQDQDPIDASRRFEPVDPYNIAPSYEGFGSPQLPEPPRSFKQRLTRLGPMKLALLGTGAVIVLGGAALGTTAALQSSGSSSTTAATAPNTDPSPAQAPGAGATTGGTGHKAKLAKPTRVTITQLEAGTIWGTDAKGKPVTVVYDATTRFGTKKSPLKPADLDSGMQIAVAGSRQGDKITATSIDFINPKYKAPATPGDTASPPAPAASSSVG